ncbi:peroxisomal biogenesis factor 13 [Brevipalpus obovatus]|uniref:peroxisomal biogenesis factor 13 n=1 Tax=Brevipalpus obovatus TaxID=246614 RepID=UPI003D9E3B3A
MATPPKPWEVQSNVHDFVNDFNKFSIGAQNMASSAENGNQTNNNAPPPLPPRPSQMNGVQRYPPSFNPYNGYNSYNPFNPYSRPMNSYGAYGGYGGINGINNMGYMGVPSFAGPENDLLRFAEENCRPAFQSLESIVQSVGSVSVMLESTYMAIYSSFRAVLGVAHQISSVKGHLSQIPQQLPLIRILIRVVKKILSLLGLASKNLITEDDEKAWKDALGSTVPRSSSDSAISPLSDDPESSSFLPVMIFFGVIFGAPWLMWTLISRMNKESMKNSRLWASGQDEHYLATSLYSFRAESPEELSFNCGQTLLLAPKKFQPRCGNWLMASLAGKIGLIPQNYVKIEKHIEKSQTSNN